jgi:broad specificity phosphatase PhoE
VPDRVGWWVRHPEPPGDDASAVAERIRAYAGSLADRDDGTAFTVAVTHSPVLRACAVEVAGGDIGEPQWLAGLEAEISADRSVTLTVLPEAP